MADLIVNKTILGMAADLANKHRNETMTTPNSQVTEQAGDSRKPKFGEWMRGIYASESNPERDGMYVRTVKNIGRMNHGTFYELTDGKGSFWRYPAKSTVYIEAALTARTEAPPAAEEGFVVVPEGFVVVPRISTDKMRRAGCPEAGYEPSERYVMQDVWTAMILAAPVAPVARPQPAQGDGGTK